ncbi:MAG: hypothetical protein HFH45_03560 [Bacilli bacterium]|nr:hypothetical protein [Bacilli bacterium]
MIKKTVEGESLKNKKQYTLFLHEGEEVTLEGESWEEIIEKIDKVLDIIKENTCYYAGYNDESIISELKEEDLL